MQPLPLLLGLMFLSSIGTTFPRRKLKLLTCYSLFNTRRPPPPTHTHTTLNSRRENCVVKAVVKVELIHVQGAQLCEAGKGHPRYERDGIVAQFECAELLEVFKHSAAQGGQVVAV